LCPVQIDVDACRVSLRGGTLEYQVRDHWH
jgi:hypothetical protein